jgi:hypothetical protein
LSKLLDSIRDADAARRALDGESAAAPAPEAALPGGNTNGDDSPLMSALRRADEINKIVPASDDASAAPAPEPVTRREMELTQNAISAAQSRESIEHGATVRAKRAAAADAAAQQLAVQRIEAEQRAEAAALARVAAEQAASEQAALRMKSERDAEAAALRNAAAEKSAAEAARMREKAAADAAQAATARAEAEAALQKEIAARIEVERVAALRERERLHAEEIAAQAAAARATLEAQAAIERDAAPMPSSPAARTESRAMKALSRHGGMIAGATAVLLVGITIGDWVGRHAAAPAAPVTPPAMTAPADMQLRIDGDSDAFGQRVQADSTKANTAPKKKTPAPRAK